MTRSGYNKAKRYLIVLCVLLPLIDIVVCWKLRIDINRVKRDLLKPHVIHDPVNDSLRMEYRRIERELSLLKHDIDSSIKNLKLVPLKYKPQYEKIRTASLNTLIADFNKSLPDSLRH